jgi:hypothetical protein
MCSFTPGGFPARRTSACGRMRHMVPMNSSAPDIADDRRTTRCPRLGHEVTLQYCRTQEQHTVCHKILDCWWEQFDIKAFLATVLTPEQVARLDAAPPPPKLISILDLVEKAKRVRDDRGQDS